MASQNELFQSSGKTQVHADTGPDDPISLASHRLAVQLTENELLPTRYRRNATSAQKTRKRRRESEIENRFKASVQSWRALIVTMLSKLDSELAWRFINITPKVSAGIARVTDNQDFCDFIDYLILRRDKECCDPDELGGLAHLSLVF